jgi:hypothetical protein
MRADELVDRVQQHGATADLVGEGRDAEIDAFADVTLRTAD